MQTTSGLWKTMKRVGLAAMTGVILFGLVGCGGETASGGTGKVSSTVTAAGSSALLPLVKDAAAEFKKTNPDVSITLNGGGSGLGLKQVSDGTVMIGNSDVAAETKLPADKAKALVDHKVAVVTVAPVVNKAIGDAVPSLTRDQLIGIFTGNITNWKEVGGPDKTIVLVTRPASSGTRALFREFALNNQEEASNKSLETDDSGTLLHSIASTEGAIGYVALPYLKNANNVTALAIDGVAPTLENTYNRSYPVWGYEHMYTKGEADGAVKAFLTFIISDEFGKHIEDMGYGVASKIKEAK